MMTKGIPDWEKISVGRQYGCSVFESMTQQQRRGWGIEMAISMAAHLVIFRCRTGETNIDSYAMNTCA